MYLGFVVRCDKRDRGRLLAQASRDSLLVCATFGVEVELLHRRLGCSYILAAVRMDDRVWHGPNAGELL